MMNSQQKDRLVSVLEKFNERLTVIDTSQAELLGSVESLRETMHDLNNKITPILVSVDMDAKEIKQILRTVDALKISVDAMLKKFNHALVKAYVDGGS
jgi:chromatin remodeling complex protein RSC6